MHIEKLSLINFKNYGEVSLDFSQALNCIVGKNGSGKTNLLDAIYYLSSTKSFFNSVDSQNIKFEARFFVVNGLFRIGKDKRVVQCSLKEGARKVIKVDKNEYEKLRQHIGQFPAIFITPYDTDLIRDGSEIRRRFFDQIISQTDRLYLDALIEYNHYLKQRNSLLKRFAEVQKVDKALLEPYDHKVISLGEFIYKKRADFIGPFKTCFLKQLNKITERPEVVGLEYESDFIHANFKNIFKEKLQKDLMLQRTTFGVHKDDFRFLIGDKPLKKFGSQGQQKSYVIALKLAHYYTVAAHNGIDPILLLDDIFDKLDSFRIQKLVHMIDKEFGQVFITDARAGRTKELFTTAGIPANFYEISEGEVKESHAEKGQ